jgi:hypothetical protein
MNLSGTKKQAWDLIEDWHNDHDEIRPPDPLTVIIPRSYMLKTALGQQTTG